MATTQTIVETLAKALNESDPNRLPDALRAYGIGQHLSPQKWTWLGPSGGATAVNIASAAFAAGASAGPQTPPLPQGATGLPPALDVCTLRVTTGPSGAVGVYGVTDAGGTPQLLQVAGGILAVPGLATLSDDGTTLLFPAAISGFVIEYIPRGNQNVLSLFEHA